MTISATHTKLIDCPMHPGKHWAILHCYPSVVGGVWECPRGGSGECPHTEPVIDTVEVPYFPTPDDDQSYERKIYVCGGAEGCGIVLDDDPEEDEANLENSL